MDVQENQAKTPTVSFFAMESMESGKDTEKKAFRLYNMADEKASTIGGIMDCFGLLTWFGGGKGKEACDLYEESAKLFKVTKRWRQAGEALVKAADINATKRCGMYGATWESAHNYSDAAACLRKISVPLAAHCIEKAAKIYAQMGELDIAAMEHHSIAELYEACAHDSEKAIEHYQKAGEYFLVDNRSSSAIGCFLRTGQLAANLEQFDRAVSIYERIAADNAQSDNWVVEALGKAVLCNLCLDPTCPQSLIDGYCETYPTFASSHDVLFLKNIHKAVLERDSAALTNAKSLHDQSHVRDKLSLTLLSFLEKKLRSDGGNTMEHHQQLKLL